MPLPVTTWDVPGLPGLLFLLLEIEDQEDPRGGRHHLLHKDLVRRNRSADLRLFPHP